MNGKKGEDDLKKEEIQRRQAIAMRYEAGVTTAPKVVAKGGGYLAEQILDTARRHGVPVYQNKTLTAMLMAVHLDREIPAELYQAVAEVLAYVYRVDQRLGRRRA